MTYTSAEDSFSRDPCFPLPAVALAPAAWYLGAHMLKCIQEASMTMKSENSILKARRSPQLKKSDKSTQTVASAFAHAKKKSTTAPGRKSPAHKGHRRQNTKGGETGEDAKKIVRRRSLCEKSSGVRGKHASPMTRQSSDDLKNAAKRETADMMGSGKQSSFSKDASTKGGLPKETRRNSVDGCSKRTPDAIADLEMAKWLKNPVYASDGESEGVRTDRSEMSPPWLDISVVKQDPGQESHAATVPGSTVLNLVRAVKKPSPMRIRTTTRPKMEAVLESSRTINLLKREQPVPAASESVPTAVVARDLSIRQIVERKLGKPMSEIDPAALRPFSEKRIKELTERYAGNRPQARTIERDTPPKHVGRSSLRARDSADSICHHADPHRERVAA